MPKPPRTTVRRCDAMRRPAGAGIEIVRIHECVWESGLVGRDEHVRVLLECRLDVGFAAMLDHHLAEREARLSLSACSSPERSRSYRTKPEVQGQLRRDLPVVLNVGGVVGLGDSSAGRADRNVCCRRETEQEIGIRVAGGRCGGAGIVVIGHGGKAAVRRRCELLRLAAGEECESGFQGVIADGFGDGRVDRVAVVGAVVEQETVEQFADAEAIGVDQDRRAAAEGGCGLGSLMGTANVVSPPDGMFLNGLLRNVN